MVEQFLVRMVVWCDATLLGWLLKQVIPFGRCHGERRALDGLFQQGLHGYGLSIRRVVAFFDDVERFLRHDDAVYPVHGWVGFCSICWCSVERNVSGT